MAFTGTARFQVLDKLGEGGMGVVYAVYDRVRGTRVAIKTLRHVDANSLYRFKREFRALSDICHPNIIALYELVAEGDVWFFSMELVDGEDLISYVKRIQTDTTAKTVPLTGSRSGASFSAGRRTSDAHGSSPGAAGLPESSIIPPDPSERRAIDAVVDLQRLRDGLGQLASALRVLHAAGMVHRDLKPSNVRVTPQGRIVLMDFGIVAEMRRPRDPNLDTITVGTPPFMAPEQVLGAPPTAAADWYAFGVIMYMALVGRLPYEGKGTTVMQAKLRHDPVPPSLLVEGIPPDLERLCLRLLARRPTKRPSGDEVFAALGMSTPQGHEARDIAVRQAEEVFVGRAHEISLLYAAYKRVQDSEDAICVFVQGPSGMGKTRLVDRFMRHLGDPDSAVPLVLSGRCHERESVPYKALDGVMDHLAQYLATVSQAHRRALLGDDAPVIAQLFPVFKRVPECAAPVPPLSDSPLAVRNQAIAALRALLVELSREQPTIIRIEDLHWADQDSLDLLVALLQAPGCPGLLLVATLRSEELEGPHQTRLRRVMRLLQAPDSGSKHIILGPLSDDEQRTLVMRLLDRRGPESDRDAGFWHQAGGHPMLLTEMIRFVQDTPEALTAAQSQRLEDVIWLRVTHLPEPARLLMEALAVAGEPTPLWVLATTAALSSSDSERAATVCCLAHLARRSRTGEEPELDAYHDKVRETIVPRLAPERSRWLHGQIARAFETHGNASEASMARHWLAAGERNKAARYLLNAAQRASALLAMDRAAELYRATLDLLPLTDATVASDRLRCRAWLGLAEGMRVVDRNDEALELLDRIQPIATRHGLIEELATLHYLRGSLLFPRGDLAGCLREQEQACAFARQSDAPEIEARALSGLGDALYMRGRIISAHREFDRCIDVCRAYNFVDMEVANLPMRGETRYYQHDLRGALQDAVDAAATAARIGAQRAEIVARGCIGFVALDMERLEQAQEQLEQALAIARALGARRFEPLEMLFLGKVLAIQGQRTQARDLLEEAVALARETGFPFVGPMALGALALVTDDVAVLQELLAEARDVLRAGTVSHNYFFFYRDAMDALLRVGAVDGVEYYARAIEEYTRREPLPYTRFFAARGRALAAFYNGQRDQAITQSLRRLNREAHDAELLIPTRAIEDALDAANGGGRRHGLSTRR